MYLRIYIYDSLFVWLDRRSNNTHGRFAVQFPALTLSCCTTPRVRHTVGVVIMFTSIHRIRRSPLLKKTPR